MRTECGFDVGASSVGDGLQARHGAPSAHDGVLLAPVLDGVEEVGEVAGGVGRGHLRHEIRLSDLIVEPIRAESGVALTG
jgi:hypothetical protein